MGILTSLKSSWAAASTAEKINLVLDIICGFGAGVISGKLTKQLAPGMNRVERICATVAMSGLGMAAGSVAAKAYEPYTESIGKIVDATKAKAAASEKKEEEADG